MKLQPLYDLQQEINRLFIAGSKFAKADPRLQKYVPVMNQLGEKAPVFGKLAKDIEDLVHADTLQSAEKLLNISTLLYSILYTQGETTKADVEVKEQVPYVPLEEISTIHPYSRLYPVIESLTTSGPGRMEILIDAQEQGVFNDSRIYGYLDIALGDKYGELAQYIQETIIPQIGQPMIPFLVHGFNYVDTTDNVRRLYLLKQLGYAGVQEMIDEILLKELPVLQAAAVAVMSNNPDNEELILKLADDKSKKVKEAAYMALARMESRAGLEKLKDIYLSGKNKTNQSLAAAALAKSKLPYFFEEVFERIVQKFEAFVALGKQDIKKNSINDEFRDFEAHMEILRNKDYPEVYDFFARVLTDKEYDRMTSAKAGYIEGTTTGVLYTIANNLDVLEVTRALSFYEQYIHRIGGDGADIIWRSYLHTAASGGYSKEKIYDTFVSQYGKSVDFYRMCTNDESNSYFYGNKDVQVYVDKVDPRWLPLLYEELKKNVKRGLGNHDKRCVVIIDSLEPKSEKLNQLLIEYMKTTNQIFQIFLFNMLMRRKVDKRFEVIYSRIEKKPNNYDAIFFMNKIWFWNEFPKEYAKKFRDLSVKSGAKFCEDIAAEIEKGQ